MLPKQYQPYSVVFSQSELVEEKEILKEQSESIKGKPRSIILTHNCPGSPFGSGVKPWSCLFRTGIRNGSESHQPPEEHAGDQLRLGARVS